MENANQQLEMENANQQPQQHLEMDQHYINSIHIKMPQFEESNIKTYFIIAEAQFRNGRITSAASKFSHLIGSLPSYIVCQLEEDVLESMDYIRIKEALLEKFEITKAETFNNLMANTTMIGKPSVYMSSIQNAAKRAGVNEEFVKQRFTKSLPPDVAAILSSHKFTSLNEMAKQADSIAYILNNNSHNKINNVTGKKKPFSEEAFRKYMDNDSEDNSYENNYYKQKPYYKPKPRYMDNDPDNYNPENNYFKQTPYYKPKDEYNRRNNITIPYSVTPFTENQRPKICRFHLYYADQARMCSPWCKWPNRSRNIQMQPSSRPSSPRRSQSPSPGPSHRRNSQMETKNSQMETRNSQMETRNSQMETGN